MTLFLAATITYIMLIWMFITLHKDFHISCCQNVIGQKLVAINPLKKLGGKVKPLLLWSGLATSSYPFISLYGMGVGIPLWLGVSILFSVSMALLSVVRPRIVLYFLPILITICIIELFMQRQSIL